MQAQPGGGAPAGGPPQGGGAPQGGGDPAAQLQGMVQQYAQSRDPQLAQQIADTLVEAMMPGGAQPGGDPAAGGGAPGGDPAAGGGAPGMMRKGGKFPFKSMKGKSADKAKDEVKGKRPKVALPFGK